MAMADASASLRVTFVRAQAARVWMREFGNGNHRHHRQRRRDE